MKFRTYKKGDPRIKGCIDRLHKVRLLLTVVKDTEDVKIIIQNKHLSEQQTRLLLHLNFAEGGKNLQDYDD